MKKFTLLVLLGVMLGCQPAADPPAGGQPDSNATSAASTAPSGPTAQVDLSQTTRYVFAIDGMQCAVACPPRVKESLAAVPGVAQVVVDYDTRTATVQADPAAFDQTVAVQALTDAGFTGRLN